MHNKVLFVAGAVALAAPAFAQSSPAAPAPAASSAPADKQFCRREQQLGSIMPGKKVCHTKAEWAAIDGQNAANAEAAMNHRSSRLNAAGGS